MELTHFPISISHAGWHLSTNPTSQSPASAITASTALTAILYSNCFTGINLQSLPDPFLTTVFGIETAFCLTGT